jgi:hypothetical protein
MSVTPSGLTIEAIEGKQGRRYLVSDVAMHVIEVPSVTTVLDVQAKPGLPWWGMKVGVEGTLHLINEGLLGTDDDASAQQVVDMLTAHKMTVNHTLTKAGDRGTRVHDAFEEWCRTGRMPVADGEDAGYLSGLRSLLQAIESNVEVDHVEVHLASLEYGFAGRCDAIMMVHFKNPLMDEGRYIVDLKTSSGIYSSHFRQLSAYELAAKESGYGDTDGGYVFWVGKDGSWKIKRSAAEFERDFVPALMLWHSEQELKGKVK